MKPALSRSLLRRMKRRNAITIFLAAVLLSGCSSTIPSRPEATLREDVTLTLKHPERWTLPSGLTVMYLPDDELPTVQGKLYLRCGSLYDTPGKFGVATAALG
ncbi:MAG: insulinase family protein, partial [Deltaproteobacteria bacterium]|nr:insulinase family protein [Deltaproteobacteria bacterium]